MISIIICSRKPDISISIKNNIKETIGCDYELVIIDNSQRKYNIFTAYNEGVRRAKGEILCFAHDDVIKYHTMNWGVNVNNHFANDANLGCIGITGSHFMPDTPAEWYNCRTSSGGCIQTVDGVTENMQYLDHFVNGKKLLDAVLLDGMWMCIRKSLFGMINFDSENFEGWHCYDTDICLQVINAGYKVGIISDVLIEHTSFGSWNIQWVKATIQVFEKWHHILPLVRGMDMSQKEIDLRTTYIKAEMGYAFSISKLEDEQNKTHNSHAYRIGKIIVWPLAIIKRIINGFFYRSGFNENR